MNDSEVYTCLVIDLVKKCNMNMFAARQVVSYLIQEEHISYGALREYYETFHLGEEDDS